ALALIERGAAQGNALIKRHIVSQLGRLADHDAHSVVDEHAPPDLGAGMNLDAGQQTAKMGQKTPQDMPTALPSSVGRPVKQQRMQPRIAKHDLQPRSGGRIARHNRGDILAKMLEDHKSSFLLCRRSRPHWPVSRPDGRSLVFVTSIDSLSY